MARTLALIGMALIAPAISAGASEDADQPATHRVSRGPFRVVVSLPAVLESPEAREVSVRPDEWTSLVVREAVDHGVEVREGQVVLALETEEIDEAIRSAELDLELSRIEHEGAQRDLELLEKSSALDVDVAERAKRRADESLVRFIEINEPLSEKRARLSAENSKDYLAYQLEELEQLEKMYRADDLTEETEEIILRRQRDSVKRAKFALEESEIARDEMLQVGL